MHARSFSFSVSSAARASLASKLISVGCALGIRALDAYLDPEADMYCIRAEPALLEAKPEACADVSGGGRAKGGKEARWTHGQTLRRSGNAETRRRRPASLIFHRSSPPRFTSAARAPPGTWNASAGTTRADDTRRRRCRRGLKGPECCKPRLLAVLENEEEGYTHAIH
jgi:hypothetical protein